jgi:hypothetical protein
MRSLGFCALALFFICENARAIGNLESFDYPGANKTAVAAISGNIVTGEYYTAGGADEHGFLYDGTTWTSLNVPGATSATTHVYGMSGNTIAGSYQTGSGSSAVSHGFKYNLTTGWTTVDRPGTVGTGVYGIDGDNLVGWYNTGTSQSGFFYDAADNSWTTLNNPNAGTWPTNLVGISGNNIVGSYSSPGNHGHGFIYNTASKSWISLDFSGAYGTTPLAVDGANVVGTYSDPYGNLQHGFLYNNGIWTTIDVPGAIWTEIFGISGNTIVGTYEDANYKQHGFVASIPEPATLLLLGLGGLMLKRTRRQ